MRFARPTFGGSTHAGMPCPFGVDGFSAPACVGAKLGPELAHAELKVRTSSSGARIAMLSVHSPNTGLTSMTTACASRRSSREPRLLCSALCAFLAASALCALEQEGWRRCIRQPRFASALLVVSGTAPNVYS